MSVLRVYDAKGQLMERVGGVDDEVRDMGRRITQVRGQLGWRCELFVNGVRVATCRRGVWTEEEAP